MRYLFACRSKDLVGSIWALKQELPNKAEVYAWLEEAPLRRADKAACIIELDTFRGRGDVTGFYVPEGQTVTTEDYRLIGQRILAWLNLPQNMSPIASSAGLQFNLEFPKVSPISKPKPTESEE